MFRLIDAIIVTPIINILFVIYHFIGDFGLAIIIFTLIVKLLTWPLMKKNLTQAKLMKKLQPQFAAIKKNCKGNRQLETLQTLELYKKYSLKPFRSVLTVLIQIPIFIALFTAVNTMVVPRTNDNIQNRAYPFISSLPTIHSLVEKQQRHLQDPAHISYDFHPKFLNIINLDTRANFSNPAGLTIFLFCIITAFFQYLIMQEQQATKKPSRTLRQIFQEAASGQEASQAEINSIVASQMSKTMPLMIFLININFPGALVFYYMTSNIMYYLQQKHIFNQNQLDIDNLADKAILKELKEAQEAQIISTPSNTSSKSQNSSQNPTHSPKSSNKKSKTNITRISATNQNSKQRRR